MDGPHQENNDRTCPLVLALHLDVHTRKLLHHPLVYVSLMPAALMPCTTSNCRRVSNFRLLHYASQSLLINSMRALDSIRHCRRVSSLRLLHSVNQSLRINCLSRLH